MTKEVSCVNYNFGKKGSETKVRRADRVVAYRKGGNLTKSIPIKKTCIENQ